MAQRDLAVAWPPCTQMKDRVRLPRVSVPRGANPRINAAPGAQPEPQTGTSHAIGLVKDRHRGEPGPWSVASSSGIDAACA